MSLCPFTGDTLVSDNVWEGFCKEHFLSALPRNELCLRDRASSGPGRWGGSPGGRWGSATNKGM